MHSHLGKGQRHNTDRVLKQSSMTAMHWQVAGCGNNFQCLQVLVENLQIHVSLYLYIGHSVAANTP